MEIFQDKDAKISFLQKAIDVVVIVSGEPLSAKPARIVAGHEPERTNELLQRIGKCCLSKVAPPAPELGAVHPWEGGRPGGVGRPPAGRPARAVRSVGGGGLTLSLLSDPPSPGAWGLQPWFKAP